MLCQAFGERTENFPISRVKVLIHRSIFSNQCFIFSVQAPLENLSRSFMIDRIAFRPVLAFFFSSVSIKSLPVIVALDLRKFYSGNLTAPGC